MLEARTISISIDRDWREVYEAFWSPKAFTRWASGLGDASLERDGDGWKAQGPEGLVKITFTGHNKFGIMDHWVDVGESRIVYVPMRMIANGAGTEITFTLFRQPGMSDAKFAEDEAWVKRDLTTLKALAERSEP